MFPLFTSVTFFLISLIVQHTVSGPPRLNQDSFPCSKGASDIVFALDSSFSIHRADFKLQLAFLQGVVDQLPYGPKNFLVGVISFGTDVQLEIKLHQFKSKLKLTRVIGRINHIESGTSTWKAIRFARTKMFTPDFGARPYAKKQLVIITDGLSENENATTEEANLAKAEGIEIFSIAVNTGLREEREIHNMASEPKCRHIFKVKDFKALSSIVGSVSGGACNNYFGDQPSSGEVKSIKEKPQQLVKKILPACKGGVAEVVFLIDSSNSMWKLNFNAGKAFIKEVIESLDIADHKTRIGVAVYSDRPLTYLSLSETQSPENIQRALDKVPYILGGTDTGYAIKHARIEEFSAARPYKARIIVLLTDGEPETTANELEEATATRKSGIGLYVVGVGQSAKIDELRALSSDPDGEYLVTHDLDPFKSVELSQLLAERICKDAVTLTKKAPLEKCPSKPSDIIFMYDSAAMSRQHTNLVTRTISAVTNSRRITSSDALRIGVVRDVTENSHYPGALTSDIELTGDWVRKSNFQRRLDPRSRHAALHSLFVRVRKNFFQSNEWDLPEQLKRKRLVVLFLDSPIINKQAILNEAYRLKTNSNVEIAVVVLGNGVSENEVKKLVSFPHHTHIIRPKRKGKKGVERSVKGIIKLFCGKKH